MLKKNKDKFEAWAKEHGLWYGKSTTVFIDANDGHRKNQSFYFLPFEMQYGVYLAFFDEYGIFLKVFPNTETSWYYDYAYRKNGEWMVRNLLGRDEDGDSRIEALKAGITKADELLNPK